jgi:hypothetical protein
MRPYVFLILAAALLFPQLVHAQINKQTDRILNNKPVSVTRYKATEAPGGRRTSIIYSRFSTETLKRTKLIDSIRAGRIERIELVYTEAPGDSLFDQRHLNWQRLHQLNKILPEALAPTVSWKLVSQKGTGKSGELNNYFHGFIIQWLMPPSEASVMFEMSAMDRYFLPSTKTAADSPRTEFLTDIYTAGGRLRVVEVIKPLAGVLSALPIFGSDTVVQKVFRRNPKWKQMEIVCDVTGSMSPYSAQVMAWYKMNTDDKKVKRFVFFNDGDLKPDNTKIIGNTGGIYEITSSTFTDVYAKMREAMNGGWGGDGPENNVEALLHVQQLNNDNQPGGELVMIADNWATPRDTSMISKLKRPVRIILCGAQYFINPAYLNIARATGGSVHLIEKDLEDLAKMREGEVLIVGSKKFTLRGGKFIPEGSLMPVQCCESSIRKPETSVCAFISMSVLMNAAFKPEDELSCA